MVSTTAAEPEAEGSARPALDAPDRAALLDRIRAELAGARPRPVARRTLELLMLSGLEPDPDPPGYRVVDHRSAARVQGAPGESPGKTGPEATEDAAKDVPPGPPTLADLVDALRMRHPALFLPTDAAPAPEPAAVESGPAAATSEMRAATARFVGAQSGRARFLATRSSLRGRALARSAAGAFAAFCGRLDRGRALVPSEAVPPAAKPAPSPAPPAFEPLAAPAATPPGEPFVKPFAEPFAGAPPVAASRMPAPDPAAAWNAGPGRIGEALTGRVRRLRDRLGEADEPGSRVRRRWIAGIAALLAALALAGLLAAPPAPTPTSAPSGTPSAEPPAQTARGPSVPDAVTPPPEGDGRGDPEPDAPAPPANALTGPVQVVDTATLRVGGRLVRLFGVEWVRGGQAQELARYIGGRTVACLPAPGSENMNCQVEGRDLSEVVLYNGGGRAAPEAGPELVAAEEHARSERLGVWKR